MSEGEGSKGIGHVSTEAGREPCLLPHSPSIFRLLYLPLVPFSCCCVTWPQTPMHLSSHVQLPFRLLPCLECGPRGHCSLPEAVVLSAVVALVTSVHTCSSHHVLIFYPSYELLIVVFTDWLSHLSRNHLTRTGA